MEVNNDKVLLTEEARNSIDSTSELKGLLNKGSNSLRRNRILSKTIPLKSIGRIFTKTRVGSILINNGDINMILLGTDSDQHFLSEKTFYPKRAHVGLDSYKLNSSFKAVCPYT
jgi:hypothetical protein